MIPKRNERIKKIIKEKRVTQQELAEHIGVRQATINAQINGDREIDSLRTIEAVITLTGCNRDWLMYGIGEKEGGLHEPIASYHTDGQGEGIPVLSMINAAREEIDILKHNMIGDVESQTKLDKVMEVITGLANENEMLKNKIISMYERWEGGNNQS